MTKKLTFILMIAVLLGIGAGYYFGYDHGWERAVENISESSGEQKESEPEPGPFEASFAIFTDGILRSFANPKYHYLSEEVYIGENSRSLSVKKQGTAWGDFFNTLPMTLTTDCLITGDGDRLCNSLAKQLKFYLNGELEPSLLDMEIKSQDVAVIIYGAESEAEIKKLLQRAGAPIQN